MDSHVHLYSMEDGTEKGLPDKLHLLVPSGS